MSVDTLALVDGCTETGHPTGEHHHVVHNDLCAHGTPKRFTCSSCENGVPAPPAEPGAAVLPEDWETQGVTLPVPGRRDAFVAPVTIVQLLSGRYVGGTGSFLGQHIGDALVHAGWAKTTFRGHAATDTFRTLTGWSL